MKRDILIEDEHNPGVYIVKLEVDRPASSGELLGKISKPPSLYAWTKHSSKGRKIITDSNSKRVQRV